MDEVGTRRNEIVERIALEQRQLLQRHRTLAPDAGLAHRVAAVVVGQRRFDGWLPARHVVAGQNAAVRLARHVHELLCAAEPVDRFGNETLRPGFAGALDLGNAVATGALRLAQHA